MAPILEFDLRGTPTVCVPFLGRGARVLKFVTRGFSTWARTLGGRRPWITTLVGADGLSLLVRLLSVLAGGSLSSTVSGRGVSLLRLEVLLNRRVESQAVGVAFQLTISWRDAGQLQRQAVKGSRAARISQGGGAVSNLPLGGWFSRDPETEKFSARRTQTHR